MRRLFRLPESRTQVLRDMDEEVAAHLALRVEHLRQLGMSAADAEAEARRRFGDPDAFRAYAARRAGRRARRLAVARWLADAGQDARVALRQARRAPAAAAVVILTLALCLGLTTAAYGVVRHLLLAPLPYPDGGRIVSLEARSPEDGEFRFGGVNAALFRTWAARSRTLDAFAAVVWRERPDGPGGPPAEAELADSVAVARVTPSFLATLRLRPVLGRGLTPADARPGAPAVALLGDSLWRARFGGDPGVVGRALRVDGRVTTVVGVLPQAVRVPTQGRDALDVLLPLDLDSARVISRAVARLRPGVTSAAASRELQALLRTFPDTGALRGRRAVASTAAEQLDPARRRAVEVLFAAAAGLLLLACANVGALLLVRAWARRREFAVRRALGAWRARLARQALAEGLLLAAPGGALGLLVAWLGLRAAVAVRPGALEFLDAVRLDRAAVGWTAAAAVGTALLCSAGPALLAGDGLTRRRAGGGFGDVLRTGEAGAGVGRATGRGHAALVVAQVALALVFVATAGVLTRSFAALVRTPVGYGPAGLVAVAVTSLPGTDRGAASPSAAERAAADRTALLSVRDALAGVPGVRAATVGTLPLTVVGTGPSAVDGPAVDGPAGRSPAGVRRVVPAITGLAFVDEAYFRVARIPLIRGRPPAAGEVVVNQAFARRLWPETADGVAVGGPVGARLRLGDGPDAAWLTVAGVAGDVRMPGSQAPFFGLQLYRAAADAPEPAGAVLVRLDEGRDPAALRPALARAVAAAGVGRALADVTPAARTLEFAYGAPRFAVALFGAFALLAVALTAVGLFGIVAYTVARRTREIGVRMALGADPARLARAVLGQGARLTALGCALGLAGALGAGRALRALVYDVSPADPAALGGAALLLAAVAAAAAALPLRRALRVDPTRALRAE